MPETDPCTHCGGTGKEPDPLHQAWVTFADEIRSVPSMSTVLCEQLIQAASRVQVLTEARITFLEAGLRDFLSYARENGPGTATMFQVSHDRVRDWKAILDGEQTQPPTINQQRAAHGLQPWPGTIGETPVPGVGGAYQRVHIDECSYGGRDHSGTCFGEG